MRLLILLNTIYPLWAYILDQITNRAKDLEKFYMKTHPLFLFYAIPFKHLPYSLKVFLLYFYKPGYYQSAFIAISDAIAIDHIRLVKYTTAHGLFILRSNELTEHRIPSQYAFRHYKQLLKQYKTGNNNNFKRLILILSFKSENLLPIIQYNNHNSDWIWARYCIHIISIKIINLLVFKKTIHHTRSRTVHGFNKLLGNTNSIRIYKAYMKFRKTSYNPMLPEPDLTRQLKAEFKKFSEILKKYNKFYSAKIGKKNFKLYAPYFTYSKIKKIFEKRISMIPYFKLLMQRMYRLRFRPSDVTQYLNTRSIKKYSILYIRRNKVFNKGRYSRNRQLYRTGVYWCLWVNIIVVFGLYFYFYRFVFNFGYMWWPMFIFILSIFGGRIIKYRYYNYENIVNEILSIQAIIMSFVLHNTKQVIPAIIRIIKMICKFIIRIPSLILLFLKTL